MKHALIIANTEYEDKGLSKLSAPGKDADAFARVLKDENIGAFDDVSVLMNVPYHNTRESIDDLFAQKKPNDLLLLYFSGHGIKDESGSLYLAVKNTNYNRLRSTAIEDHFIKEAMDQSRSKKQVVILDCCNSGAFTQGTKAIIGGSVGTAAAFQGTGYGRVVLTASDATQFAWEGETIIGQKIETSLFTHFLILGLQGEADKDGDGKITVDELYEYAYEQTVSHNPNQTPGKWSYNQKGEFVLRERKYIANSKYQLFPISLIDDTESFLVSNRQRAIKKLATLLRSPDTRLSELAREKLEDMEMKDDSRAVGHAAKQILDAAFPEERLSTQKEFPEHEETDTTEKEKQPQVENTQGKTGLFSTETEIQAARQRAEELVSSATLSEPGNISINGGNVKYEALGRGRPVVFLHSWIGSWDYWYPSMQYISGGFHAYALDLFGYGESTHDPLQYVLAKQSDLVNQFLNVMGIGRVAIIGHGLGALVGMHFIQQHPNSVDRMMAVGYPLEHQSINPRMQKIDILELAEWISPRTDAGKKLLSNALKADPVAIYTSVLEFQTYDLLAKTRFLGVPCLFVNGTYDPLISTPAEYIMDVLPLNFHQITLERSGHFPMIDNPNRFNTLLMDFLTLDSGASPRELIIDS